MKKFLPLSILAALLALTIGCGGNAASTGTGTQPSSVFVTAEDAPVSSVVAFNITINSITLNNGSTSVAALSTPTAVDFGRLVGLRSLLGFNTIPPGTYTSATFTFEAASPAPSVTYLDFTQTPPVPANATGTLSASTVTIAFPTGKPLVVTSNGLAGLHMDFDLRSSLANDGMGNLIITKTGSTEFIAVTPTVDVMAVSASDDLGQITDFTGNVVSINSAANSFVMQGPYGFQRTIDVAAKATFNGGNAFSSLMVDGIVSVIGTVQADGSILASDVELITTDKAFISGRILSVSPGPVVTMFVGEELGTSATIPADSLQTIDLSGVKEYDICFFDNLLTDQLFNASSLLVGQRIFVGGTYQSNIFSPVMVSLRRQGVVGALVPNSVSISSGNQGSFQMKNDALMSYSAGGPFTVDTGNLTRFVNINGLAGLQAAGSANLISRGLVFKDQGSGKPYVVAGRVRVLP